MSTGKSFRIEKEKRYVHTIAFKIDNEGLFKLDDSFELLNVRGKRRSDKMRDFIAKVHTLAEEHTELLQENEEKSRLLKKLSQVERENRTLKRDLAKALHEGEEPAAPKAPSTKKKQAPAVRSKPSPPSMRQITLTERAEFMEIHRKEEPAEEPPKQPTDSKAQFIWCPDKDEWITPVKCGQCQTVRFNTYRDCQERRRKNPNDPIFKPSKPKPSS